MPQPQETISIEVKVTSRCNQECFHCANNDGPSADSDIDGNVFIRRLEEWTGTKEGSVYALKEVRLTGGEPLVNFQTVLDIVKCCQRLGIRSGINTNGLLFNAEKIRLLKESGLEVVKVSFDAITLTTYNQMRGSLLSLQEFTDIIQALVKNRFKVILRYTLSSINLSQLPACYNFAREMGVHKFQVKPLIRAGRAKGLEANLSPDEVNRALQELSKTAAGKRIPTEILCWPPAPGLDFSYRVCGSSKKIYVSTRLKTTICNFIEENGAIPMGDLATTPLEVILRRRAQETMWLHDINGYRLVKGCPNTAYFAGRST
jgi:MoaA/NifB/PqqE/SkfB family radical SAM enzyme